MLTAALEAMFDDPGMALMQRRNRKHPALSQYEMLRRASRQDFVYPDEIPIVQSVGGLCLDLHPWALGREASIFFNFESDQEKRKRLQSRLAAPDQYEDVITEISTWSSLRERGTVVGLADENGQPDLRLVIDRVVWGDVKRVHLRSNSDRAAAAVSKANEQVRRQSSGPGVAFLKITRPPVQAALDERLSADVSPYVAEVRAALARGKKFLSHVVVTWDDYVIEGEPPATTYAFRRQSMVLANPAVQSGFDPSALEISRTVVLTIRWGSRRAAKRLDAVIEEDIEISEQFRTESEAEEGVRAGHALEAIRSYDAHEAVRLDENGYALELFARRVDSRHPHHVLVMATRENEQSRLRVAMAFRLFDDVVGVQASPQLSLRLFIQHYGEPIQVGGQRGKLIESASLPLTTDGTEIVRGLSRPEHFFISVLIRRTESELNVRWAFAINRGRYRSDIRRHRQSR